MAGRGRGRSIDYIKPAEPSFLKKFKEQVGYKEGPTVETKREIPNFDDLEDKPEGEDEKPVVVVLKDGDLTQDEADTLLVETGNESQSNEGEEDDTAPPDDGRIVFKKPSKRSSEQTTDHNVTSSKKKKKKDSDKEKKKHSGKKVKNSSLLSFGDDEEEET